MGTMTDNYQRKKKLSKSQMKRSKLIKEIQYIEIQAATNMALICLIKTRIYLQRESFSTIRNKK